MHVDNFFFFLIFQSQKDGGQGMLAREVALERELDEVTTIPQNTINLFY